MSKEFYNTSAVLITTYNRPDFLSNLLEISAGLNLRLYLSVDYPKNIDDIQRFYDENLRVIKKYSKSIYKLNLFESHQGCFAGVTNAISWAFEFEEKLIILEDDIVFDEKFLNFTNQMLLKFAKDLRVGSITGLNLIPRQNLQSPQDLYRFSWYTSSWGWATWRDRWLDYLDDLEKFPKLTTVYPVTYWNPFRYLIWKRLFNKVAKGEIDSWAYRWLYSNWIHKRLTVCCNLNLITNIGFDLRATHTKQPNQNYMLPIEEVSLSERNSLEINLEQDLKADAWMSKNHFKLNLINQSFSMLSNLRLSVKKSCLFRN